FFFFLTLPPHPTSTLFPYTTLFRSFDLAPRPVRSPQLGRKNAVPDRVLTLAPPARRKQVRLYRDRAQAEIEQSGINVENDALHLDRKSTRLNSSHLGISYAVFCLKK